VSGSPPRAGDNGRQRVDRWLWHARVVRTRTAAQALVTAGKVRVNRERIDASSRAVKAGDVLTIALPGGVRVLKVVGFAERRGPPELARQLYEDLTAPAHADGPAERPDPAGSGGERPTKRDRRAIDSFRSEAEGEDFPRSRG
jgi:ribosome-associated heat shock protein Hsp15